MNKDKFYNLHGLLNRESKMNITAYNNSNIAFQSGQTKILSDFDGTFMPKEFNHDVICNDNPPVDKNAFNSYFDEFSRLLSPEDENGETELTVSTGRNLFEFNYYMKKIKEKGLKIPVPDKLIITNGGDEFIKNPKSEYFSSNRENMFNENDFNPKKQKYLRKFVINWDGYKIKNRVKSFISRLQGCPVLLEPLTHQGMYGYRGDMTLQEDIQKLPDEDKTNYISLRRDGNSLIRLTAPAQSPYVEELKGLKKELEQDGFQIDFRVKENNDETFVNSASTSNNWQMGTSIEIKPKTRGKVKTLDKYHHAKLMVDDIMQNNLDDLVIVCGDGKNDLDMLDLSNYIDSEGLKPDDEEFKKEISKLPLRAIFVRNSSNLDSKLAQMEKDFNFDGKKRFIIVDKDDESRPHTLIEAIKLAKDDYSNQNPRFKKEQ